MKIHSISAPPVTWKLVPLWAADPSGPTPCCSMPQRQRVWVPGWMPGPSPPRPGVARRSAESTSAESSRSLDTELCPTPGRPAAAPASAGRRKAMRTRHGRARSGAGAVGQSSGPGRARGQSPPGVFQPRPGRWQSRAGRGGGRLVASIPGAQQPAKVSRELAPVRRAGGTSQRAGLAGERREPSPAP